MMKSLLALFTLLLVACQSQGKPPIEIGIIQYRQSLKLALEESKQSGKPIFLLFQEVPG